MVIALPRLLGTAWNSARGQQAMLAEAWASGDALAAGGRLLALVAVALPVAATAYLLARIIRRSVTGVWKKTRGKPLQRTAAAIAAVAVAAGLAWAWWPDGGNYRPVQRYERGTLLDAAAAIAPPSSATITDGRSGETIALWPEGSELPSRDEPRLAMVLVPQQDGTAAAGTSTAEPAPAWVFPFDKPPAPAADGNQALAVNTRDGSVVYAVAFALVWAEDGPVDTANEAYAFASCKNCAAVAVGFQVVLVVGQANVVVPENLSAAANYNCVECLTYALASQLVVTLDGPLSDAGTTELAALWERIADFGRNIQDYPLSEIQQRLNGFKAQILDVIERESAAGNSSSGRGSGSQPETTAGPAPAETVEPQDSAPPEPSGGPGTANEGAEPEPQPAAPAPNTAPQEPAPQETAPATEPPATPAPPPTAPADTPPAATPAG
jgi:putative peptide zinc metalloprotease protein